MNAQRTKRVSSIGRSTMGVAAMAALALASASCGGGGGSSNNTPPPSGPAFTSADLAGKTIQFGQETTSTTSEIDAYVFGSGGSVTVKSTVLPSSASWTVNSDGTLTVSFGSTWRKYTLVKKNGPFLIVNSTHSDGNTRSNVLWTATVPFTTSLVVNTVVQYTGASGLVTYRFYSDNTVAIITGGTWLAYGTWAINADGTLTVTSGSSTLTFTLIQNGTSYSVNYSNGSKAILNSSITVVDPTVSAGFEAGMLVGKSLQVHVSNGAEVYGFNADGSVTITLADGSVITGTWAIQTDGSLNIGWGSGWAKYTLVDTYGTFVIVNVTGSSGSSSPNITLTYVTSGGGFTPAMLAGKTLWVPLTDGTTLHLTFNADYTMSIAGSGWPTTANWVINADGTLTLNFSDASWGWMRFIPVQNTANVLTLNEVDRDGSITLDIDLSYNSGQSTSVIWAPPSILNWTPPTTGGGYTPVDQVVIAGSNVVKPTSSTWQFTVTYVPEDSTGAAILDAANNPTVAVTSPAGLYTVKNVSTSCVQPKPAQGLGLGVIIDDSTSMATSDPDYVRKTAVNTLIDALGSADAMALTDYEADTSAPLTDLACWTQVATAVPPVACAASASSFISDKAKLHAGANMINSNGSRTPLYEACVQMVSLVKNVSGKQQSILLLSDGQPNGSYSTASDCINAAKNANVRVYTLGVGPAAEGTPQTDTTAVQLLRDLAQQTGGTYAAASQASSLVSLFSNMGTAMQKGSCSSVVTVTGSSIPTSGTAVAGTIAFGATSETWSLVVP